MSLNEKTIKKIMSFMDEECGNKKIAVFVIYDPEKNKLIIIRHNVQAQDVKHFLTNGVLESLKTDPSYTPEKFLKTSKGNIFDPNIEHN